VTAERLFLVEPKPTATGTQGGNRVSLSLN
jgi:hypothetical protein